MPVETGATTMCITGRGSRVSAHPDTHTTERGKTEQAEENRTRVRLDHCDTMADVANVYFELKHALVWKFVYLQLHFCNSVLLLFSYSVKKKQQQREEIIIKKGNMFL